MTIYWSKASGPVTYYLLTYGENPGAQTYGNPNVGNANTTNYTVKNLSAGKTYYFRLRAGNDCMPGDFSPEVGTNATGAVLNEDAVATGFEAGVLGSSVENSPAPNGESELAEKVKEIRALVDEENKIEDLDIPEGLKETVRKSKETSEKILDALNDIVDAAVKTGNVSAFRSAYEDFTLASVSAAATGGTDIVTFFQNNETLRSMDGLVNGWREYEKSF